MGLVTVEEITHFLKIDKLGYLSKYIGRLILKITKLSKVNKIYNRNKSKQGIEFFDAIIKEVGIQFKISDDDLNRIPAEGSFITISNHPLGGIDGIILMRILLEKRSDFKIIANFLLGKIDPLKPYILEVNPFGNRKEIRSSVSGIKSALNHTNNGHPFGIFPSGEVSTSKIGNKIIDKEWEQSAIRLIQKAEVPIIPIYFKAKNSNLFYFLSKISPFLRTAKLPSELFHQKHKIINVRIGKPITLEKQKSIDTIEKFGNYLRTKTYMLANCYNQKNIIAALKVSAKFAELRPPKAIIRRICPSILTAEVASLRSKKLCLLKNKNYEVYLATSKEIPSILLEIGRLREITFREIGEGTNKSIDIDKFDVYFKHLFLWDFENNKLVGAYRMGFGKELFLHNGIKGFYISSLFRINPALNSMLKESIEMGRAFIIKEYQQKPMPLYLLWKGIIHTTLRHPGYKYLIGSVSISNKFSHFSKSLMIDYMNSHHFDPKIAKYINPRKKFKVKIKPFDKDFIKENTAADLNKLDKIIAEIEPHNLRIPVLFKKYIQQNVKVVAFNVDPKFNNALDGLIYVPIKDIPESTMAPAMEEYRQTLEKTMIEEENQNVELKIENLQK